MKTLKFRCILKTDVIINQNAATMGNNKTLDFIPGNNFLGIVASHYKDFGEEALIVFHSGKIRFGDANPVNRGGKIRSLMVPAMMYHPKDEEENNTKNLLIFNPERFKSKEFKELNPKQCRSGFYMFDNLKGTKVALNKNFALKSAYDRVKRRSADEKMFGYESMEKDSEFLFEVEIADGCENFEKPIKDALVGLKRIGRSRTAQYGLVKIEPYDFEDVKSNRKEGKITIYADGRLIFIDQNNGQTTFTPKPFQLGIQDEKAEILWEKSQIRTFQYAPWNFKRQARDTDRCGIEKGSVFVVKTNSCPDESQYVGSYKNEGFGKVIYNPEFLEAFEDGRAKYSLLKNDNKKVISESILCKSNLLDYLYKRKKEEDNAAKIYKNINDFVEKYYKLYKGISTSQWGVIRSIAISAKDDSQIIESIKKYINHGVKSSDWFGKRYDEFLKLMENNRNDIRRMIVNLSSQMAKQSVKEDDNEK